jgi:hypothetical protein
MKVIDQGPDLPYKIITRVIAVRGLKLGAPLKIKKWANGSMNDKRASWRLSRCPWEKLLYKSWKSKGGGKKAGK